MSKTSVIILLIGGTAILSYILSKNDQGGGQDGGQGGDNNNNNNNNNDNDNKKKNFYEFVAEGKCIEAKPGMAPIYTPCCGNGKIEKSLVDSLKNPETRTKDNKEKFDMTLSKIELYRGTSDAGKTSCPQTGMTLGTVYYLQHHYFYDSTKKDFYPSVVALQYIQRGEVE